MKAKDLIKLGYKSGPWIPMLMEILEKGPYKHMEDKNRLAMASDVLANPEEWRVNTEFSKVVEKLYPAKTDISMRENAAPVEIYGASIIEEGALHQIFQAAKLPVSVKAALMPDAHSGYGLPIGGVLACKGAVIPYGVGVDIGCRMALTLYPMRDLSKKREHQHLCTAITKNSFFGTGVERKHFAEHEVMDSDVFNSTNMLRNLRDRAGKQLGTSGSGNHFVEFGELSSDGGTIPKGEYLALLTHSGSRGLGANIAKFYTNAARRLRKLNSDVSSLAWLYMNEQEGMEYWAAMTLAGEYAKANHDVIHKDIAKYIGERPIMKIENHHNFAWKEMVDGEELIVHRKGATPAGKGILGIIPGSMSTPGYVVEGTGNVLSLNSASHGAGRAMSRSKAKETFVWNHINKELQEKGVTLIGGGVDECSGSYKDVNEVMRHQTDLVNIIGKFTPRIVRMAGADQEPED